MDKKIAYGAETVMAQKNIGYFEEDMDDINEKSQYKFRDGIIARIVKLGYCGKEDNYEQIIDFICDKFTENDIRIIKKEKDNTRVTIRNWIKESAPNDSEQSRPNVYKLCFALEMDEKETEEFFLKNYLCRPFNYKDYVEAVYFFCLKNRYSYSYALELIKKIENLPVSETPINEDDSKDPNVIETRMIGIAINDFTEEEDFLDYMEDHRYSTEKQYRTVYREVTALLQKCKELANVKKTAALLRVIYGYDESLYRQGISKSEYLPRMMTSNFPSKMKFSEITSNGKNVSHDTYRKALMILKFYDFYTSYYNLCKKAGIPDNKVNFKGQSKEFEVQIDTLLDKCGYIQTYPLNPFDNFLLFCSQQENPLDALKNIIAKYYTSVVDELSDDDE